MRIVNLLYIYYFVHCQSSAENSPRLFSAATFPISIPTHFFLLLSTGLSFPHLLHADRLAKFMLAHLKGDKISVNF